MQYPWNPVSDYLALAHGGKRAFARMLWHRVRAGAGAFERYRQVDWQRVSRVVFVCKGNICRSAFAGSRFRTRGMAAASAGLDADPGKPADPRAARVARCLGTDLGNHRSTHIAALELGPGDLLVAFEPDHADRLRPLASASPGAQLTLLGLWSPAPPIVYFHDPYGCPETYFEACFRRIEGGLAGLEKRCINARPDRENRA
ncbi:MAG: protein tyrosine phosphatase [Rhodocyclaceae bacterium]|nr:protein tyrosine phosphatase [Rhodocyclaceae bacterium]